MGYLVINGNQRKIFESLKEASSYITEDSKVYELDSFGNLSPVKNDILLKASSPEAKEPVQEQAVSEDQKNVPEAVVKQPAMAQQDNQKKEEILPAKEKVIIINKGSDESIFFKALVFIVVVLVILFFVYTILRPYIDEWNALNSAFF